jgi:FtsH-binding integral membrane protein
MVTEPTKATPPGGTVSSGDRRLVMAMLAVLIAVFALVYSNVAANHSPKPHNLPVGIVGPGPAADAARAQLARVEPGGFKVYDYASLSAAKTAVLNRSIYGAYEPAPAPVLLTANAASPPVAALLQRVFGSVPRVPGRPLVVDDVAPLPPSDSSGATIFSALLGLIIAGLAGSSIVYAFTRHRREGVRIIATTAMAVAAGLITALVTTLIVGSFSDDKFFVVWGVASLFVLAIGLPIAAFQVLFGLPGVAIGFLLFLVIGNPASGGSSAPELLPSFWRGLSQALPPGAAVTSMRDVVYFSGHGSADALIVLSGYTLGGAAVAIAVARARAGTTSQ